MLNKINRNETIVNRSRIGLDISLLQAQAALTLREEGCTLPFIARYRKDKTNGLDEEQLRKLFTQYDTTVELESRKKAILEQLTEKGILHSTLRKSIELANSKKEVEELYKPYKTSRVTLAQKARKAGLTKAKTQVVNAKSILPTFPKSYICKEFPTEEDVWTGIGNIIEEELSLQIPIRNFVFNYLYKSAAILIKKTEESDTKGVYKRYYDFHRPIRTIKPYQTLAIVRGEKEKILKISFSKHPELVERVQSRIPYLQHHHPYYTFLNQCVKNCLKTKLLPQIKRTIMNTLKEKAYERGMYVFGKNLHSLFLQKPIKPQIILGIDPGYKNGCKWAIIDKKGSVLTTGVFYPTPPWNKIQDTHNSLKTLYRKFSYSIIAIGNGTAHYETAKCIAEFINKEAFPLHFSIVPETGASIYSASKLASEEFPTIDLLYRGAISIARRLQDPLAEYVKIPPESLGVGMYQHDLPQKDLHDYLHEEALLVINSIGVNLNTTSKEVLQYISGLHKTAAKNIVEYRDKNGFFTNRSDLKKVKGIGQKTWEQCIGFCRVPSSNNPFDNTRIHPESYSIAEELLQEAGSSLQEYSSNREKSQRKLQQFDIKNNSAKKNQETGVRLDIYTELLRETVDCRTLESDPILYSSLQSINDIHEGDTLEGTVSSITDFGIFVDIGIEHSGFIPIKKPIHEIFSETGIGKTIRVTIQEIDIERERILLNRIN